MVWSGPDFLRAGFRRPWTVRSAGFDLLASPALDPYGFDLAGAQRALARQPVRNIEESDPFSPVLDAGDRLGYVHIGESHRGYLGSGTVDFHSFLRALNQIGYDGPITFESFSTAVVDETLSRSLAVWRNLWDDSDDLGAHARTFIRKHDARRGNHQPALTEAGMAALSLTEGKHRRRCPY